MVEQHPSIDARRIAPGEFSTQLISEAFQHAFFDGDLAGAWRSAELLLGVGSLGQPLTNERGLIPEGQYPGDEKITITPMAGREAMFGDDSFVDLDPIAQWERLSRNPDESEEDVINRFDQMQRALIMGVGVMRWYQPDKTDHNSPTREGYAILGSDRNAYLVSGPNTRRTEGYLHQRGYAKANLPTTYFGEGLSLEFSRLFKWAQDHPDEGGYIIAHLLSTRPEQLAAEKREIGLWSGPHTARSLGAIGVKLGANNTPPGEMRKDARHARPTYGRHSKRYLSPNIS